MNRLEQQFLGQPTAHEKLFIMSVHSHWCPCQRIKLKTPINTHESIYTTVFRACVVSPPFHFPSWHSNLGASLCEIHKFISKPETSRERQRQRSSTGFARAIIFSTSSDQIFPTRWIWRRVNSSSSRRKNTRIFRKNLRRSAVLFVENLSFNFLAFTSLFGNIASFVVCPFLL